MPVWQTPKTDWNSSQQGVTAADFNRIEGNALALHERMSEARYISFGGNHALGGSGTTGGFRPFKKEIVFLPAGSRLVITYMTGLINRPDYTDNPRRFEVQPSVLGTLVNGAVVPYDPAPVLIRPDTAPGVSIDGTASGLYTQRNPTVPHVVRENTSVYEELINMDIGIIQSGAWTYDKVHEAYFSMAYFIEEIPGA